ncbi:MAG: AAA family ATPase [Desulfoarculaceae bacterium]|nr:AAA family ATPase [Desulfoarculaceae bacterium]
MKIIAIYSSKGGVGKTATAVNLSYSCARSGRKTLLCDIDPQGAAGYYYRIKPKESFNRKLFLKGDLAPFIRGTDFENLDLLPAHFSFRNLDIALDGQGRSTNELKRIFAGLKDEYDVLILDCPPNMTLLSENIIMAADLIVTPVIPTTLSILSFAQLIKLADKLEVKRKKLVAFFSMVDKRKNMHTDTILKFGKKKMFLVSEIPYLADVEKMGIYRQPVAASAPSSSAAIAYEQLWLEVWRRGM